MSDSSLDDLLAALASRELDQQGFIDAVSERLAVLDPDTASARLQSLVASGRIEPDLRDRLLSRLSPDTYGTPDGAVGNDRTRVLPGGTTGTGISAQRRPGGDGTVLAGARSSRAAASGTGMEARSEDAADSGTSGPRTPAQPSAETGVSVEQPTSSLESGVEPAAGVEIKGRFRLLERLGQGGMGTIWKAVDKRREEARDRNPYIAIKLLAGDFRNHPEAFIALQRECAKQQRLAHPNIATVYDFDRDGDHVYMTMGLLEGQPLDAYIRGLPAGGLESAKAMGLVEQLAAGLAHAHANALVHSDLKPGNCFLLEDGTVRLLDFGIARASRTRDDADGETTLFDAGALGALTPTYATVEMFDGADPDPRDDIYALAIITYQLLTGEHPYAKKSAPKAMQLGLTPAPIAKLDRRQNRGLQKALSFLRDERTSSVAEFLSDLRPRKSRVVPITVAALLMLALVGGLAHKPLTEHLRRQQNEAIIGVFERGDAASIAAGLAQVEALPDPRQRREIAEDPRTRGAIVSLYEQRAAEAFDPAEERHDYAGGSRQLDALDALYPDSAEVLRLRTQFESSRARLLQGLEQRLREALAQGRLVAGDEGETVGEVIDVVREVAPTHPLLTDQAIEATYVAAARAAQRADAWQKAETLLQTGLALMPASEPLAGALATLQTDLEQRQRAARATLLERRWRERLTALTDLTALEAAGPELNELRKLAPGAALFDKLAPAVDAVLATALPPLLSQEDTGTARNLLRRHAALASLAAVDAHARRLGDAAVDASSARRAREELTALVAAMPTADSGEDILRRWAGAMNAALARAVAESAAAAPALLSSRDELGNLVSARMDALIARGRLDRARRWLELGRAWQPGATTWASGSERLAAAERAAQAREAAKAREARLASLRQQVLDEAEASRARQATDTLARYATEAGAEDSFVLGPGREAVAGVWMSTIRATDDTEAALALAGEALTALPGHAELMQMRTTLRRASIERALAFLPAPVFSERGRALPAPDAPAEPAVGAAPATPAQRLVVQTRAPVPAHPALESAPLRASVADRLAQRAEAAAENGYWGQARSLLADALLFANDQGTLKARLAEVDRELTRQRDAARTSELLRKWQPAVDGLDRRDALDTASGELRELRRLAPAAALFDRIAPIVDAMLEREVPALATAGDFAAARALLARHAPYARLSTVERLRDALGERALPARANAEVTARLVRLTDTGPGEGAAARWLAALTATLAETLARTTPGDAAVIAVRERLAKDLEERARRAAEAGRFDAAERWLVNGQRLAPTLAGWAETREALADARSAAAARLAAQRAEEQRARLREEVLARVAAGDAAAASTALAEYAASAPEGDDFAARGGRIAVAEAWMSNATAAGSPEQALAVVEQGLARLPGQSSLTAMQAGLSRRVLERALALTTLRGAPGRWAAVAAGAKLAHADAQVAGRAPLPYSPTDAAGNLEPNYPALRPAGARVASEVLASTAAATADPASMATALSDYDRLYPGSGAAMRARVATALSRAIALRTYGTRRGLAELSRVADDYRSLLASEWRLFADTVGERLAKDIRARQANDLAEAHALLARARELLPESAPLESLRLKALPEPSRHAPRGFEQVESGLLDAASETLARMRAEEPAHEQLSLLHRAIEERMREAQRHHAAFQRFANLRRLREGKPYLQHALTLWSDNKPWREEYARHYERTVVRQGRCSERLAGHGRQGRGACYDELAGGGRGPLLVVVPPGGGSSRAYAIGKFELSVGKYNAYCRASRNCKPRSSEKESLPVTGISARDAESYAAWLSQQSGAVYRLPSDEEWAHAAGSGGQAPRGEFNCRVTSGGNVIKGHGLVDAQSGQQNDWGLANYVGNAQEWVRTGNTLWVRGGAFEDPLTRCETSLRRAHDGGADPLTGFRLVRELS